MRDQMYEAFAGLQTAALQGAGRVRKRAGQNKRLADAAVMR
jgi:hypothetical protein